MVRIYVLMLFSSYFIVFFSFSIFRCLQGDFFTSWASQRIKKQTRPTAEADLSLPVMLWCIIPKWIVNGLRNLYGVKVFFLEIVAGICSIASVLLAFTVLVQSDMTHKAKIITQMTISNLEEFLIFNEEFISKFK